MQFFQIVSLLCSLVNVVHGASTFSPTRPPAIPLAVRSPYLSAWLQAGSDGGNGGYLAGAWPTFWTGQTLGWTGMASVDGRYYLWMGRPYVNAALAQQTSFTYTSTRSTFVFNLGGAVTLTVEFLSPITPNNTFRASLPITYMNVGVASADGKLHDVSVYTDISAEWISGDRSNVAQWNYGVIPGTFKLTDVNNVVDSSNANDVTSNLQARDTEQENAAEEPLHKRAVSHKTFGTRTAYTVSSPTFKQSVVPPSAQTNYNYPAYANVVQAAASVTTTAATTATGIAYHQVFRQTQQLFSESSDQAEWGNWYYSTANTADLTYQSGKDTDVRGAFLFNGKLSNYKDTNYRPINLNWPVFGFCRNLGSVGNSTVRALFTISHHQRQAIQFESGTNVSTSLSSLWAFYWSTDTSAITSYYKNYGYISSLSTATDNLVSSASLAAAGQNYLTITSLAVRQAFGGLQLTYNYATGRTNVFLKEISSDGNIQTVDVIFPLHTILLFMNPTWLRWLLEPLYINQEAGNWPYAFSIHDLGAFYPNATGHNDGASEMQPLEECGNMIIMTLAYAQRANDNTFLSQNYDILRQWNEYLVEEALIPSTQISTDDFAGPLANQTNLAIKGIIGIAAMAEIATRTGNTADATNYTNIARDYVNQWQTYAINTVSPAHTSLNYGNTSTWNLLYNLYSDRELGLDLVPQSVYDMQSAFYPTVAQLYGVPLDNRHLYTKLDWELLCAAVAGPTTRDMFMSKIASWIGKTPTQYPMTDLYMTNNGSFPVSPSFKARPVVGGVFALLALQSAP